MKPFKFLYYKKKSSISNLSKIYPFTKVMFSFIDSHTYISYNCTINNCKIGKFCSIASGVKIGLGTHPINFFSTSPIFYSPENPLRKRITNELLFKDRKKVEIGNDVWIGANVIVLDGVKIGNGAIVGANSLVNKDIGPYEIVGGVPAKIIRKRFADDLIDELENLKWWDFPFSILKSKEVISIFSKELNKKSLYFLKSLKINK